MPVLTKTRKTETPANAEVAGRAEYENELNKLSSLSSQLSKLEADAMVPLDRTAKGSDVTEAAERFIDGQLSLTDLGRAPGFESRRAELERQLTILRQAVSIQQERVKRAKASYATNLIQSVTPRYREMAKAYVNKLVEAARIAEQMHNLSEDCYQQCDRGLPELSRGLLGRIDDGSRSSRISQIIFEMTEAGIIRRDEFTN